MASASAACSARLVPHRPRWLARIQRTLFVGLGPMATCWQWLRDRGRSPHQRYQAEEEARRKRRQHKPHLESLEKRGSPGVPVDPAAMLVAGLAGVSIVPQGLFRHDAPATFKTALPVTAPPIAMAATSSRAAFAKNDTLGPPEGQPVDLTASPGRRLQNVASSAPVASSPSSTTPAQPPTARVYDSATGQWRPLPDIFPATAHLPPDGDSTPPAKPPVPSANPFIPAPHLPPDLTPDTMPTPPARHVPQTGPTAPSTPVSGNVLAKTAPGGAVTGNAPVSSNTSSQGTQPAVDVAALQQAAGALPLRFEANVGQSASPVRFLAHGNGFNLFLTDNQAVMDVQQVQAHAGTDSVLRGDVLRTSLVGANPNPSIIGLDPLPGRSNYFASDAAGGSHTDIIAYGGVEYQDLYPGISLVYYGSKGSQIEYDFLVAPGADPSAIHLQVQGAAGMAVDAQGNLVLHTPVGGVTEGAPLLYQPMANGARQPVSGHFVLDHNGQVSFSVGAYDHSRVLDIDPTVTYGTYLGGSSADYGYGVAVDAQGYVYVTGKTQSTNFPTTTGAYQTSGDSLGAVFVTKLNPAGNALVYSTYIDGATQQQGNAIAADGQGDAYVTGQAFGVGFPTTSGAYRTSGAGFFPAFVTKLNSWGNALVYSTLLGGTTANGGAQSTQEGYGLAIDGSGEAYVTGFTNTTNFPTTSGAAQTSLKGTQNAFVTEFNSTGSALVYSTYLGGTGSDTAFGLALDSSGKAYVTGSTSSTNFPTTSGAYQTASGGGSTQAFVTKLTSTGGLSYSSYLGGSGADVGYAIALDGSNNAYVTGSAHSTNFPTTTGAYQTTSGGSGDAFVTKFNSSGSGLSYSTYLRGSAGDTGYGIAVDSQGMAIVVGSTSSTNFPTLKAFQSTNGGSGDAFVTKLNSTGTGLTYSSYLGSSTADQANAVGLDQAGNAYVVGQSNGSFPVTSGSYQTSFGGGTDAFVAKVSYWGLLAQERASDPEQGQMVPFGSYALSPQTGNLRASHALNFTIANAGSGQDNAASLGGAPALAYNSETVHVYPIVEATLQSDSGDGVPSQIQAQLTWNGGSAQGWVTYSTTGHSAGDTYDLAVQSTTAVTATGTYPWSLEVKATLSGSTIDYTLNGTAYVVANAAGNGLGNGWSLAGLDYLVANGTAGVLFVKGQGDSRYFTASGGGAFVSPLNDFGTLSQSGNTYTYTARDQSKEVFNSSGQLITASDPDGLTVTCTYSSGLLSTIQEPDGSQVTFNYSGGLVTSIQEPGSRTVTLAYSAANDLTLITNPGGGLHTLAYDTSHRLTSDAFGPLLATMSYDATSGETSQVNLGNSNTLTIKPANAVGLATSPAANANQVLGVTTDGLSKATTYTLDGLGRASKIQFPTGAVQQYQLDLTGQPAVLTDPLSHVTTLMYQYYGQYDGQASGMQQADGTSIGYQYDSTFHQITQFTDPLSHVTTMTYSGTTGDPLTTKNALSQVTSMTWSSGLLQTTQDALGHTTTYQYNASRQLTDTIDAAGARTTFTYDSAGNLATIRDPLNHVTTVGYDALGRETLLTGPTGAQSTMAYDAAGNLISETDPLGHVTNYGYNTSGEPTSSTAAAGTSQAATTTAVYDADGNVLSVTDPLGRVTSYGYDSQDRQTVAIQGYGTSLAQTTTTVYDLAGNTLSVTNPLGVTTSYGYDSMNRQTELIEANGTTLQRITTYAYDSAGNQTLVEDPLGIETTMLYDAVNRVTSTTQGALVHGGGTLQTTSEVFDAAGNVLSQTDGRGYTTSYGFDSDNRQTQLIEAYGTSLARTTTTIYGTAGNTLSVTSPLGVITSYAYDSMNRQTQMIEAYGLTQQRASTTVYDAAGNTLSVTNGAGQIMSYAYDALNRETQQIEAYGTSLARTTTTVYDSDGEALSVTNPLGTVLSYGYDALGRETAAISGYGTALAQTVTTAYDTGGDVTAVTDAGGFITTTAYDSLQRQTTVQDPGGGVTTTLYDVDNNVTGTIDPNGNRSTFAFDSLNRETTITDARGGVTTMVYDLDNNEVNLIDPVGNKSTFGFDALNRETLMTDPLGASATYAYSAADQQTSATDRDGRVTNTSYDPLGRETGQTWISGGSTVNVFTFTYDAADNPLTAANYNGAYTMGYDALNRMTSEQEPFGLSLTFHYDGDNNRTLVQDSFGGVLTSLYDNLDRLTSRQFGGASQTPLRLDLAYNSRNDISTVTRYSDLGGTNKVGYSTYSYDSVNRVTNIQHQNGSGSMLANATYTYDSGSRVTSETAGGSTRTFQYDKTNELTSDGLYSYSYDLNGNRTMSGYTSGTGNELTGDGTWTYAYDGEGNTISKRNTSTGEVWTYGYDNHNRMTAAKDVNGSGTTLTLATYIYDALGNQVEEDVWTQSSGTTTFSRFGYDGDQVWADLSGSNALQTRYIRGDEVDQLFARIASGNVAWYLTDWQGSVRNLTDGTGTLQDTIAYDGFGGIASESNASFGGAYKYAGYRQDSATGQSLTAARTFDPGTGRWTEQNQLSVLGGDTNLYRYAHNNATNYTVPSGLSPATANSAAGSISCLSNFALAATASATGYDISSGEAAGKQSNLELAFPPPGPEEQRLRKQLRELEAQLNAVMQDEAQAKGTMKRFTDRINQLGADAHNLEVQATGVDKAAADEAKKKNPDRELLDMFKALAAGLRAQAKIIQRPVPALMRVVAAQLPRIAADEKKALILRVKIGLIKEGLNHSPPWA